MNFKDGDKFFQEFEELAHYSGVHGNEQVMVAQIKRATRETSKNTIYAADGDLPVLYNDWKTRLLRIDFNWRLKQAESTGRPVPTPREWYRREQHRQVYQHRRQPREPPMEDEVSPWILAQQLQRQSVTDVESSVTLNVTTPPRRNPEQKHYVGAIPTGTRRMSHWSQLRR